MCVRHYGLAWVAALLLALGPGCSRSPQKATPDEKPVIVSGDRIARLHWLGKERIAADSNSAGLMQIWREPTSARVEAQTLDKLAAFPWKSTSVTNSIANSNPQAATNALRALLEDVLQKECYAEVRQPDTNHAAELAFAIRLDQPRAGFWQTNLAVVLASLTGTHPVPTASGWELTNASTFSPDARRASLDTSCIRLTRAKEWTVLTFSSAASDLATNSGALPSALSAQFTAPSTNWLETTLDPRRLAAVLGLDCKLPEGFPVVSLTAFGDGQSVHTRGGLLFPKPLPPLLEPWAVPTNFIGKRLVGFTAARGTAPLLRTFPLFSELPQPAVPTQVYLWDEFAAPFHLFFALASEDAKAEFTRFATPLPALVNPRLPQHCGAISVDTNAGNLVWDGLSYGTPFLTAYTNLHPQFLYGGFGPHGFQQTSAMPGELLDHLREGTNLVYYDFEITSQRLPQWRYLDDVYRILFDKHGPRLGRTASMDWVAANLTNLEFAATEIRQEGPARLSFARRSTIGLSALEIDLAANWLELPEFPRGLTTLLQTNGTPLLHNSRLRELMERRQQSTNTVPPKGG